MRSKESPRAGTRAEPGYAVDAALVALAILARCHGIAADPVVLRHRFAVASGERVDAGLLLRAARTLGLKARAVTREVAALPATPLPALALLADGGVVVLAATNGEQVLIQDPSAPGPAALPLAEFTARWRGQLVLVTRRAAFAAAGGRFDLSWFLPAVLRHRRTLAEVLAASLFLQLLGLVTPLIFQVVIDKVLTHGSLLTLDVLVVGLLLVALFESTLGGLRGWLFAHTATRLDVRLGADLYRHLQSLPLAFFESRPVGTVVARVRELERLREFLTGSALTLVLDLVFGVAFLALMFAYSPRLTAVVLATLPLYIALSLVVTPMLRRRLDEQFQRGAESQAFLTESVAAAGTVKAMAVAPQMQRHFEEQLAAYAAASFRTQALGNVSGQLVGLINKLASALLLWWGARLVLQHELTVGQLVAFNLFAGRVNGPVLRLAQLWQDFQQARLSVERLGDVLNAPAEPGSGSARAALPRIEGRVRFERVSFRYGSAQAEALREISLDVAPGEVVGIVGRSGSGKSTLTRLLQRLYVPESGSVRIDGVDLAQVDPLSLRRQIGVVLQENLLFHRSVRDNIALADPGLPLETVMRAALHAGAHEFIVGLPQGYDTIVAEHGANLSGGQRQRIAIARALVTNPRILVFDEATSALDYESERVVQQNLRLMCRGRTVFIIAHRLSAVRDVDRIVVLDAGRIVEQGAPAELAAQGGHFARMAAA